MVHRLKEEDSLQDCLLVLCEQLSRTSDELVYLHHEMKLVVEESKEILNASLKDTDKLFETFDLCQQKLIDVSREYNSISDYLLHVHELCKLEDGFFS